LTTTKTAPPLGIPQLERLRRSIVGEQDHPREPLSEQEFAVTRAVLDSLGVGLEPVHRYLYSAMPTLEQLERWLLDQVGGGLDGRRITRANAIAAGDPTDDERLAELARIEQAPPALSEDDLASWARDGYVIVRAAAPEDACVQLERAVWDYLDADPQQPASWYRAQLQMGTMVQLFNAPGIEQIHATKEIHKAFSQLLGTPDLVMTADRCGFNPPVLPGYPYRGPKLHFGIAGFEPPLQDQPQGIVYLADADERGGAFRCVPGFHRRIEAWLASLPPDSNPNLMDLEALGPVPIAAQRGDLVIWRSTLPHGPGPNTGARPSIVHYLSMYATPSA
jgi:Phytanoyl-CoA dioxygenase (PhyH)